MALRRVRACVHADRRPPAGLDNLADAQDVLRDAQAAAAEVFGAASTFFLVNGSSGGIHAAVMAACPPGATLLFPRNAHSSVHHACALAGAPAGGHSRGHRRMVRDPLTASASCVNASALPSFPAHTDPPLSPDSSGPTLLPSLSALNPLPNPTAGCSGCKAALIHPEIDDAFGVAHSVTPAQVAAALSALCARGQPAAAATRSPVPAS